MTNVTELSEREVEILRLLATGASNKDIAQALFISPNTVKVHLRNIFAKIGAVSRTEATLTAMRLGLVASIGQPPEDTSDANNGSQSGLLTTLPEAATQLKSISISPWLKRGLALAAVLVFVIAGVFGITFLNRTVNPTQATSTPFIPVSTQPSAIPRWQTNPGLPEARSSMAGATFESALYLFSGTTPKGTNGNTLRYTPSTSTWESLAAKPTPVSETQAAVLGEKIYIPGGRLANGQLSTNLEAYSPRQNRWEQLAPLPTALSGYALAAFEGDLYLFGGWDGSQFSANVYTYDPESNQWQSRKIMPTAVGFASALALEGRIYLFGGRDGLSVSSSVRVYYPSRERTGDTAWEERAPLPEPRYALGAAILANMIYVVGGETDNKTDSNLSPLQYMPLQNRWERFERAPLVTGSRITLLALDTRLHVIGGQTPEGFSTVYQTYQAIYTISLPSVTNP